MTGEERAAIQRFVNGLGVLASVEEFERTIRSSIRSMSPAPDSERADVEFSEGERAALQRAGANFDALPADVTDPVEKTRLAFGALMLDTNSVDEVAANLRRDVSRIRQRIRDRSLWAIPGEAGSRLPRAQFEVSGEEIAGMARLLQALPEDLHPIAVVQWLTRPNRDLRIDDTTVSPRDWLRAGGRLDQPLEMAQDLHAS